MNSMRRPFWLPAPNYYAFAFVLALAFFFAVWGVLDDIEGMHAPWETAGVSASFILIGAVILREVFLRRSRAAFLRQPTPTGGSDRHKLTVERAATILAEIKRKSEAANVLDKIASGHREVYELCAAFMQRIDRELAVVQAGSPRLAALLKSRGRASELHKFHTLRRAEIEATTLSGDAQRLPAAADRMRSALAALAVVDEALVAYPSEETLIASRGILTELAFSIEVANIVEEAEAAVLKGNMPAARELYSEALSCLDRGGLRTAERERAAGRILAAIDRLSFSTDNS